MKTIEQLQRIMADESRPEAERKTAAEHILKLQESNQEPAAPPAAESAEETNIKRIFDAILGGAEERQEIEDQTMQVCAACFFLQRKENETCELCGDSPEWLVPSQARKNPEHEKFVSMAADYTVEQLKTALHSGWGHTSERRRVAHKLLAAHEARLQVNAPAELAIRIDLSRVASYYDYRLAQLQAEKDRLERQGQ